MPHPEGKYVALETDGALLPPIDLGDGKYKDPEVRKREEKSATKDRQPTRLGTQRTDPTRNQCYNVENKRRYRIKNFFGERFEWYPNQKYFCSFFIKGIEGQLIQQNIALQTLVLHYSWQTTTTFLPVLSCGRLWRKENNNDGLSEMSATEKESTCSPFH